ncbi:MAG: DUF86 domain-containing protein [Rhodospirillales bacterium]|nr:DUF86 domain-containing protein [Rhodospirillales bacterium]
MRRDRERLADILAAVTDIADFTEGMTEPEFLAIETADRKTYRAIIACLIALGEAVKALSDEVKARHPEIDWRGYGGLRDIFTHQYFQVQLGLVWTTITQELPALREAVREELERTPEE